MKKIILQVLTAFFILTPVIKSQSNIAIDAGAIMEIQTGADVCSDTRTINGLLTGNGTWCLIPLTPAFPLLVSPANLSVGQNLSLNLVWQKSFGGVSYRVQLSTDSLFNTLIVNDSTLTDSVRAVSGLAPLTYYWWRVSSKGIGGTSSYSAVYKFRTLGYPNAVSLINPPNNAVNQPISIVFRWSRATEQTMPFEGKFKSNRESKVFIPADQTGSVDAIGNYWFDLVTDTVSFANLTRDTLLTDTTKSVVSLSNNTNYYWRVRAKNQIGWGGYSVWFKFTTIVAVPAAPLLVSPPNNSVGQNLSLNLVWNKPAFATNYRVQLSTDSLFNTLIVNDSTLTDSVRVVSGLISLTNYWWRVNAKNVGGTGVYSIVWKFRTVGFPTAITLLNPPNNSVNQPVSIQFRWSKAIDQTTSVVKTKNNLNEGPDAVSNYWYELVTDTVSMANLNRDTLLTDTTKTVSGLNNAANYWWRVKA
jgi:hypothetical protein